MDINEILIQVNDIFIDILDNGSIVLTNETTSHDIAEWDSLTHIHLVVAIEKHFKISFASKAINNWNNVGEIVDYIKKRLV